MPRAVNAHFIGFRLNEKPRRMRRRADAQRAATSRAEIVVWAFVEGTATQAVPDHEGTADPIDDAVSGNLPFVELEWHAATRVACEHDASRRRAVEAPHAVGGGKDKAGNGFAYGSAGGLGENQIAGGLIADGRPGPGNTHWMCGICGPDATNAGFSKVVLMATSSWTRPPPLDSRTDQPAVM